MNDLKIRLLAPEQIAHPAKILGTEVCIRRLTAFELAEFEDKAEQFRTNNDTRALALAGASLVLNALVDENGLPAGDLPAPDELIKAHSYASLIDALTLVQRHSYGALEDAKKN